MQKEKKSTAKNNPATGCIWLIIYVIGFILIISGLGLFGLSIGIIGAVLAYTNIAYREWLSKQRGYKFCLSKLPGMASSSPTVLAIATIGYSAPLSLLSWFFLLGSFSKPDTIVTVAIMGVVGIVLLFGWLIKGWGLKPTQQVEPENVVVTSESRSSAINLNEIIDYFKQYRLASIVIVFALFTPLFCYMSGTVLGPIIITPTPTPTPVTPTLKPTATVIPSGTPSPIATNTPMSTTTFTRTLKPTTTVIPAIAPSNTPAPTPTEKVSALLPGLTPEDVTENLKKMGLTCSPVERGQLYYVRMCEKDTVEFSLIVDIYGRELFSVDYIDSSVIQYTNVVSELPKVFFGFLATMPYDGAVQDEARMWVEATVSTIKKQGDSAEKVFAGVTYRLSGLPTFIIFEMGGLP